MSSDDLFGNVSDADLIAFAQQLDTNKTSAMKALPAITAAARPPPRPSPAANQPKTNPSRPLRPSFNSIIVNTRQVACV